MLNIFKQICPKSQKKIHFACYLSTPQERKAVVPGEPVQASHYWNSEQNKLLCQSWAHSSPSAWKAFPLCIPSTIPPYLEGIQFFEVSVPCSLLPMELITFPVYFCTLLGPITMHLRFILIAWTRHAYNKFKHYLDIHNENRVFSLFPPIPVNHLVCILPAQFLHFNMYILTKLQHCHI